MKIISGGQTGADRAGLDVAIELGLDYGGSVPRGRRAEDGPIDPAYARLAELGSRHYRMRTEQNVKDGDATLLFTEGAPTEGTSLTLKYTMKHGRPCLLIDLAAMDEGDAITRIVEWLGAWKPRVLNVAGPRESKTPGIYRKVYRILKTVLLEANPK
jgi:hypothetical protein